MNEKSPTAVVNGGSGAAAWRGVWHRDSLRTRMVAVWVVVLTLAFIQPLIRLMREAAQSELSSYVLLVPFVAGYLLSIRQKAGAAAHRSAIGATLITTGAGIAALTAGVVLRERLSVNDGLVLMTLAYVSLVAAGGFLFLGSKWMAAAAFPVAFLFFMVPLPDAAVNWLETASVLASADVSAFFFRMSGTPILREGTVFALPTIVIRVAQECSGIHSSWVLFITSLVASNLFLESAWRRVLLVAFVIPLAIIRNAFRILVIGLLCVHVGPHMIDSPIHRHGGPLFFALSLIPLFGALLWLRRREHQT